MLLAFRLFMWVFVLLIGAAQNIQAEDAIAMVTDLKGSATVTEKGQVNKLALLSYLMPNVEIKLEKDSKVVITYFSTPKEFVFAGPALLKIAQDAPKVLTGDAAKIRQLDNDKVATAKKFTAMQREKLSQATFEMRSVRAGVRLSGPVETKVLNTTPMLRWFGPSNVSLYHLTISRADGKVIQTIDTSISEWSVPKNSALSRGETYLWKVETTLASGEQLSAASKFTVLDETAAQRIQNAQNKLSPEFSERVLYAMMLEAEGLAYEASLEWQALSQERPDDVTLQEKAIH